MGTLLTTHKYAKHVGVTPMRIYQLLTNKVIRPTVICGRKYIDISKYGRTWFRCRPDRRKV